MEEANKLMKDVVDSNFISKLRIADQQAEKYFSEGPTSVVYGNVRGFDAVVNYYQEAERASPKEPELLLHFVEFFMKGTFKELKTGHRCINDAQKFHDYCVTSLNKAKEYAEKKQAGEEYITEIERKRSELLSLLEEELPKAEELCKLAVKGKSIIGVISIIAISVLVYFFALGGASGSGSQSPHNSCSYVGRDREYFAGPMVDKYYNYDHPEWGWHTH